MSGSGRIDAGAHGSRPLALLGVALLLATFLNYANRVTLNQTAVLIKRDLTLSNEQYAQVESAFGYAFAAGGVVFGVIADRVSVRWLYPVAVIAWSMAGASTGLASTFGELWWSRLFLGLFEAAHWSCALRTTQRVLAPDVRTRGNSILQSGASLGAIATPLLVILVTNNEPGGWRSAFFWVGLLGLPWGLIWLASVSEADLKQPVLIQAGGGRPEAGGTSEKSSRLQPPASSLSANVAVAPDTGLMQIFLSVRFWVLLATTLCINTSWHYIRVWMPMTLAEDHGYSLDQVNVLTAVYYSFTFIGCIAAGWLSARLANTGLGIHRARMRVFLLCGLLTTFAVPAALAPGRETMLICMVAVACGSLGLFPIYYSLVQEISGDHQGKVSGSLTFASWFVLAQIHPRVGAAVDADPSVRPWFLGAAGLLPLVALGVLWLGWRRFPREIHTPGASESTGHGAGRGVHKLSVGKKLPFSAFVLCGFLGTAEVICRVFDLGTPPPRANYIADWKQQWQGEFYTFKPREYPDINDDGLRDRPHAVANPDGKTRIVCLGDSVVFGFGPPGEQSFPAMLQRNLTSKGQHVEVFNVALPGWSTRQERIAYERIARRYRPRHVVLGVCLNDLAELQNNLLKPPPAALAFIYRHSALVRAVMRPHQHEIRRVEELFDEPSAPGVKAAWERFFAEVDRLESRVRSDGGQFWVLVFPFRFQVTPDAPAPRPQERIGAWCAKRKIPVIDALDALRPLGEGAFWDYDHLSRRGSKAVAVQVAAELRGRL